MVSVLVMTSTYPLSDNDTLPPFVKNLTEELSLAGDMLLTVLTPSAPGAAAEQYIEGVRVLRYRYCFSKWETLAYGGGILANLKANKLKYLLVPLFIMGQILATVRLLHKEKFDLIHAHWILPQGAVAALSKKILAKNIPFLVTSHGADLFSLNGFLGRLLKRWTLENADMVTVVSKNMKNVCANEFAVPDGKVQIFPMGVDLSSMFTASHAALRDEFGVVFVGRLVEKKGVEYLIESFETVLQSEARAKLTIVGDGPLASVLKMQVHDLGLSKHVVFVGAVRNSEIPEILRSQSIAVVPSVVGQDGDQEGLGLTSVEAMGCGCAVVASDLPAIRDVVENGKTGILVPEKNSEKLADAILMLICNQQLRDGLAYAGRASVFSKFDWKVVVENYRCLLNRLASESKES